MTETKRVKAYHDGVVAETLACNYMRMKGYRKLEQRYKTKYGEIDLIFEKDKMLVFCEVKARRSYEEGVYAITQGAQKRITRAAEFFLSENPEKAEYDMSFDALIVVLPLKVHHIPNAWLT